MTGKIECMECKKFFSIITQTHLKLHNITLSEYKLKYPNAPTRSDESIVRSKQIRNNIFEKEDTDIITDEDQKNIEIILDNMKDRASTILKQIEKSPKLNNLDYPKIEELNDFKIVEFDNPGGYIHQDKVDILSFLLSKFQDVKNNFFVEKVLINGAMEYRYVTDIVLYNRKINIEFPNSFWHNFDVAKASRDSHLTRDGWKIINVNSTNHKVSDVIEELKKHNLI